MYACMPKGQPHRVLRRGGEERVCGVAVWPQHQLQAADVCQRLVARRVAAAAPDSRQQTEQTTGRPRTHEHACSSVRRARSQACMRRMHCSECSLLERCRSSQACMGKCTSAVRTPERDAALRRQVQAGGALSRRRPSVCITAAAHRRRVLQVRVAAATHVAARRTWHRHTGTCNTGVHNSPASRQKASLYE